MRLDPHSFADSDQPQTRSIDLSLRADFAARVLEGEIVLRFRAPGGGPFDLDTRDLALRSVMSLDGAPLRHQLSAPEPILGARLRVELPPGTAGRRLRHPASPPAPPLQTRGSFPAGGGGPVP